MHSCIPESTLDLTRLFKARTAEEQTLCLTTARKEQKRQPARVGHRGELKDTISAFDVGNIGL